MCGITGSINFKGLPADDTLLKKMAATMAHRGPDDSCFFRDGAVAFGFNRLSIIDLTGGRQPMSNENRTIHIIFNGEIYNFRELRKKLEQRHTFATNSDTEIIIHGYEEWGERCVEHFIGMFAFALYDEKNKKVILARDRLGIKPLYYSTIGDELVFASEMKAILAHPKFDRTPSLSAISSYLTFRYPQWDQPVFANIKRLPPGHLLTATPKGMVLKKYWEIPFHAKKEDRGETFYLKRIGELLSKAVERRMQSDVPVGAYLSGGLDSSIVVALMAKLSAHPPRTFSIGFPEDGYSENHFAELVAQHTGAHHTSITLAPQNYIDLLPEMIRIKDAPLSIPHETALLEMSRELKKHVTVVLSGEGADELFGGYGRVQRSPMDFKKIMFAKKFLPPSMRRIFLTLGWAGKNIDDWLQTTNLMEHFFSVYHWIPFEEKWSLFTSDVNQELRNDAESIHKWESLFESIKDGDPYDQLLYVFEKNHLACLLDRLDIMSMAASVEARVPFVDHELVEFVSEIPHYYKLKWRSPFHQIYAFFKDSFQASERLDTSKDILRRYAQKLLPPEIVNRKKLGFPVPLDRWFKGRTGMHTHARDILLDERTQKRGLFKKERLEKLLLNPQNLDYDFWGKKVWMLMNVELWYREFIDKKQ